MEEKKLKSQIQQQESTVKQLQHELNLLNLQIKEKDQEYRLNELKIKELRRQLPTRVLKPLDAKYKQASMTNSLPPQVPKPAAQATTNSKQDPVEQTSSAEVKEQVLPYESNPNAVNKNNGVAQPATEEEGRPADT